MKPSRKAREILNEPELGHCPQVKMLGYDRFHDASRHRLPLHHNPGIEVCILLKGRFEWTIEDRGYQLYQNDCTFTLPWQRHGGTHGVMDAGELVWIIIAPERYDRDGFLRLGDWSVLPPEVQTEIGRTLVNASQPYLAADNYLKQVFQLLFGEISRRDLSRTWRINRLLDEFLYYLAEQVAVSRVVRRDVFDFRRLQRKITAELERKWTLDELAELTGYGKTMMHRLIRQQTGFSPMEMIRRLRIDQARNLLSGTTLPVTDIALRCGFPSSQQFATAFKKISGQTPSAWREHRQTG